MQNPPLQPLHLNSVLSQAKLNHYARLTTEELIRSLEPGQIGALKTRPDWDRNRRPPQDRDSSRSRI